MASDYARWRNIPWDERPWVLYSIVGRLQPDAHLAAIYETIEQEYKKDISITWLFNRLEELHDAGYLHSERKMPRYDGEFATRSGRDRLHWYITGKPRPAKRTKSAWFGSVQEQTA